MGSSIPKKKKRKAVCLACDIKCQHYRNGKNWSYSPARSHKVAREDTLFPNEEYLHCKHYDLSSYLNSNPKGAENL